MAYGSSKTRKRSKTKREPLKRKNAKNRSKAITSAAATAVKKEFSRRVETKYLALTNHNEKVPEAIQSGAKTYHLGLIMGTHPSSWTAFQCHLGGIALSNTQREGLNVYLKHTTLQVNIDMKHNLSSRAPCEFRVIHAKQRRSALPAGITTNPGVALFLNTNGNPFGHASTIGGGVPKGSDLMMQPLNRREFIIYSDKRFYLQKPSHLDSDGGGQGSSGPYKCARDLKFTFKYNKNTRYNETSDLPENLAYHHFIYIYARSIDQQNNADNWEINTRGTTTYEDL